MRGKGGPKRANQAIRVFKLGSSAAVLMWLAACAAKQEPVQLPPEPPPVTPQSLGALQPLPPMETLQPPAPELPKRAPGPGFGAHMASYNSPAVAERGWEALAKKYSTVRELPHSIKAFDPPSGGPTMSRLVVGDFPTAEEAFRFCDWAKQQNIYCGVMPLVDNAPLLRPEKSRK